MGSLFSDNKGQLPAELSEALTKVEAHLPDDPQTAFYELRPFLAYPTQLKEQSHFQAAVRVLGKVAKALGAEDIADLAPYAAKHPLDRDSLYALGYSCYENRIFGVGAMVLHRAHKLFPADAPLVCELSSCLEELEMYKDAAKFLQAQSYDTPMCSYLQGFNSLMSGDLNKALDHFHSRISVNSFNILAI